MFDIHEVRLENFKSYKGQHAVTFPKKQGLYLVTGINETEPRLGANGVGKSTLLDAIFWCLYGKTARGLKAGDIITWGEKSCTVSVKLFIGDELIEISRSQNPNSLRIGRPGLLPPITDTSQDYIQKVLRLGPEAFLYSVMLPQFGESFFDLAPAAKLTLFSEIMELEFWLEKSKAAEALAAEINNAKAAVEGEISKYKGQLEVYETDTTELKKLSEGFSTAQDTKLVELTNEMGELKLNLKMQDEATTYTEKAIKNALHKLEKLEKKAEKCPACGQPTPDKDRAALLQNISDFERQLQRLKSEKRNTEADHKRLVRQALNEQEAQNPYEGQLLQKRHSALLGEKRLKILDTEQKGLQEDYAAVAYWGSGFKRLRLYLVEQTLHQLEIEVNNNMASLGLTDWRVKFDVERENKSGGVTKGFVVFIYAPGHTEPVRWEAFSGGETQRLRLAGDLGLANLIMERAGLRSTIEFFDEPSRHLSQEGLLDVAETLDQRADLDGKRIMLVDHATIDFGGFAGRLFITKGRTGSRLE